MRVILVGAAPRRARLRAELPEQFDVVAEADSLSSARRLGGADAYLVAGSRDLEPDVVSVEPLTRRELEVLTALADGLSNKGIAGRLGIADETVKFHLSAIFGKLQASNRTDAVKHALRRGLIEI